MSAATAHPPIPHHLSGPRAATATRLVHMLAVEINTGMAHPAPYTGGASTLTLCARLGLTHQPQPARALRELITHCVALDPTWRPTPHIHRALRRAHPSPPTPTPPRRGFDRFADGRRRARRPVNPAAFWGG